MISYRNVVILLNDIVIFPHAYVPISATATQVPGVTFIDQQDARCQRKIAVDGDRATISRARRLFGKRHSSANFYDNNTIDNYT